MASWNQIEAQWSALTDQVKAKWNKLTDEDLEHIAGRSASLVSTVQERYGVLRVYAEKHVSDWADKLSLGDAGNATPSTGASRRRGRHER